MLEALLEPIPSTERDSEVVGDKLDEEDRLTIEKCIASNFYCNLIILVIQSIRRRLEALRRKLDFASQRNSPTPSIERIEQERARRLSSASTGSAGAYRGSTVESPSIPSTVPPNQFIKTAAPM